MSRLKGFSKYIAKLMIKGPKMIMIKKKTKNKIIPHQVKREYPKILGVFRLWYQRMEMRSP